MMKIFIFIWLLFIKVCFGKVDPPNYDFSLDQLKSFYPSTSLEELKKNHGEGKILKNSGETQLLKFYVSYIRYKFPVVVQVDKEKILDMHATLPTYFLHNIFHQGLISRYGKQDEYIKKGEEAFYRWSSKDDFIISYSASCTITCFPVYLSISLKQDRAPSGFKSQLSQMDEYFTSLLEPSRD